MEHFFSAGFLFSNQILKMTVLRFLQSMQCHYPGASLLRLSITGKLLLHLQLPQFPAGNRNTLSWFACKGKVLFQDETSSLLLPKPSFNGGSFTRP